MTLVGVCLAVETKLAVKKMISTESLKQSDSTISLRLYENVHNTLVSSLEIVNVENIYEEEVKVGQSINIVTYYYDLSGYETNTFLQPFDSKHNKVYASLISSNDDEKFIKGNREVETPVKGDHGFQDHLNSGVFNPIINVVARIAENKLHVRGIMIDYHDDITRDDLLLDNFEIEVEIPPLIISDTLSSQSVYQKTFVFALLVAMVLLVWFVMSSDLYRMT